jgi:tryptophan-rich sensory protein
MRNLAIHAGFVVAVMAAGLAVGLGFPPGDWYAGLAKPGFTPPNGWFGPIWTVLYVLIGLAGARVWLHGGARGLWVAQMGLNLAWTPVFFGLHLPIPGLLIILALLAVILAFIRAEWRRDRVLALMFLPYAVWVGIATALNAGIVMLN